ncbi:MAG: lytic murein transglycosylase [Candidatus Taylorbacteria bacterium]|nr:lytic murein transglycosylase [Candidatus Taylorbacteria bacterium]
MIKEIYFYSQVLFLVGLLLSNPFFVNGVTTEEFIRSKSEQIEELTRQIEEYQRQIEEKQKQGRTLTGELDILSKKIVQIQAEIRSLSLGIEKTNGEISQTTEQIKDTEDKITKYRSALGSALRILDQQEQENLIEIILKNENFSDFFGNLTQIQNTQENLRAAITGVKESKADLEEKEQQLYDQKKELENLKVIQQIGKNSVEKIKTEKNNLLKVTKGEESNFQQLVKKSQTDIEKIRAQITYLQQNGVSAEDAVKFAQLAAIAAGIRPAFLLAELEQESALGSNVGKCYIIDGTSGATRRVTNGQIYTKGIHPTRDLALFLNITAELGKDPFQTPISCGSSWGGAMGPAQFIPSTWMGYREEVARLTGHKLPDPWNIEDSFTAAAAKLSRDGASSQTRAGEVAASKRYYCGNAVSIASGCINYANSVQRLAEEINNNL